MIDASLKFLALACMTLPCIAAAETVRFPSATTPPTPLQQRLAQERGQPVPVSPGTELTGELYRPAGDGMFPAVVMLHGCAGRPSREREDASGAYFASLGYALLIVDSFGPRGITERCATGSGTPADRVMDAFGALLYLARLPFIDPDRIAVLGYSQGGEVALSAVKLGGIGTLFERQFRAAVAYYPYCEVSMGGASVPTVVLIGELDDITSARQCQEMMARRSGDGAALRLVVYPGAHHAFNSVRLRGKPEYFFGHLEYNEAADHAAHQEMLAVLRQAFGR
ncbi:dienelactone hydrolase family protein [Reyranella sp.]|uniref:dienelactone hydrolase family protein n=1 Tax=Reyranella sp. TaxID=1929291 RepID=UPI0027322224|nr:dienelactone hydrolase family protein [Reyranella sp.]MDP2372675.1 dienelactone hydrolase family protein [Reyranella sp.]